MNKSLSKTNIPVPKKYSTYLSNGSKLLTNKRKKVVPIETKLILFNKPYNVLTQFTPERHHTADLKSAISNQIKTEEINGSTTVSDTVLNTVSNPVRTLADFIDIKGVYPAGRLDKDSEGLLLLTNDGKLQAKISHPRFKMEKEYWVQVEGEVSDESIKILINGVELKDGITLPAQVTRFNPPELWERIPPIRERKSIPTSWLKIIIKEGRNRQVRRMTAAVGHPTLRLIRYRIGHWTIDNITTGNWVKITPL